VAWNIESLLHIDRVTRLEKLTVHKFSKSSKERAAICLVDEIWKHIATKADNATRSDFAPMFGISSLPGKGDGERSTVYDWEHEHVFSFKRLKNGLQYVRPIAGSYAFQQAPRQRDMEAHNEALLLSDTEFDSLIKKRHMLIENTPFLWESCSVIAGWFDEMEKAGENSSAWQELLKDPKSLVYFRMWQCHLREMGKLDARAIFVFEHLPISCVVG
jgi:hypothetical protein